MGAQDFVQIATGKTLGEAYDTACREAEAYYGHQEGYSGAINATSGIARIENPGRVDPVKFAQECLTASYEPARIPKARRALAVGVGSRIEKWGPALGIEFTPSQAFNYRKTHDVRRGHKVFVLFGLAAS